MHAFSCACDMRKYSIDFRPVPKSTTQIFIHCDDSIISILEQLRSVQIDRSTTKIVESIHDVPFKERKFKTDSNSINTLFYSKVFVLRFRMHLRL